MSDNPSTTERVVKYSEEWWATRTPEVRARRCHVTKKDGDQCGKVAMDGQRVCGTHGGRAPQAKAAARRRLDEAADRMARELLKIATTPESESVKLSAVRDALDRAGLKLATTVEVGPKQPEPWEELLGDVAHVTRAQHEAMKRGQPMPPAPANPRALPPADADTDIVDAEVVDAPAPHPERVGERADRPNVPDWAEPPPAAPPSRELVTLEDAAAEVTASNRAARVSQTRRRRR
ncbi:hypothetical protein [Mycobacterium attenuatum]|uniref:hypothetical protein n=1 Tax=Mycobacterium attenuatum TaxID=2341086 RepID=UPI0010A96CC5|nr:hypothetical protein [Mycobacterium attenuatum]